MRTRIMTLLGLSTWALLGCPHSDGADTTPAGAAAPAVAPAVDASLGVVAVVAPPLPAELPDAAVPDASASATGLPDMTSAPAYPPSALYDTFSKAQAKLIACYLPGKKRDPKLRGKVIVKWAIHSDGSAHQVVDADSTLQDPEVIACVIRTVKTLRFTKPVEGNVTVTYPLIFRPTGDETLILPDAGKP